MPHIPRTETATSSTSATVTKVMVEEIPQPPPANYTVAPKTVAIDAGKCMAYSAALGALVAGAQNT